MKTYLTKVFLALFILCGQHIMAQEVIRQENCDVTAYQEQIDSLKSLFKSKGFIVLREASMSMQSEYEMPIVVAMSQGSLYEFVFIGDPSSRLYEVRMYDWNEKQVVYQKKMWGDVDGNIISYAYSPQFSEYHMIKPVQVNRTKKKLCGYVLLLKKTNHD
ncbi:MAG: hypothetical protein JST75_15220 [Bacteroidetes bacterium]|nr:hypothetical protein [Bacteroidota bacterium]